MLRPVISLILVTICFKSFSQQPIGKLTVEKIMRDPKWIGTSPASPQWSNDGNTLSFQWNPNKEANDSSYYITKDNKIPVKATVPQKLGFLSANTATFNTPRTAYIYAKDGDVFYTDPKTGTTKRITQTFNFKSNPQFSFN